MLRSEVVWWRLRFGSLLLGLAIGCDAEPTDTLDAGPPLDASAIDAPAADAQVPPDASIPDAVPPPDAELVSLTISHTGDGVVAATPPGATCGGTCTLAYPAGTEVLLQAVPDTCRRFGGWSGDCSGTGDCSLVVDADKTVSADFYQGADLVVSTTGTGTGTVTSSIAGIDCGADCDQTYDACELVTLSATPDTGFRFEGWTGDCEFDCACELAMDTDHDVTASFGPVDLNWARAFGGADHYPGGIAVSPTGEITIAGAFDEQIILGGETILAGGVSMDIYIVRVTATGDHIWHRAMAGAGAGDNWAKAVATDSEGNVLVGGYFSGDLDFGDGDVTANMRDAFVSKYAAADGSHMWTQILTGPSSAKVLGIGVDDSDDVIITGQFDVSIDIGGTVHAGAGSQDGFLAKLSGTDGSSVWSRALGDMYQDWGESVGVDSSGDVLLGGTMAGLVDFGCGTLFGAGATNDAFVGKFDGTNGDCVWSSRWGGNKFDYLTGLAVGPDDGVVVTGYFEEMADFGGGTFTSAGHEDGFVSSFASDGSFRWAQQIEGVGLEQPTVIAIDSLGNAVVGGQYKGLADFGSTSLCSVDERFTAFVARYDTAGTHLWTRDYGDDWSYAYGITTDDVDNVLVTGQFNDSIDFGGGPIAAMGGGRNSFLVSLQP